MNISGFFVPSLEGVRRDLRYTLRGMRRRPAFTFAAVQVQGKSVAASRRHRQRRRGRASRNHERRSADRPVLTSGR